MSVQKWVQCLDNKLEDIDIFDTRVVGELVIIKACRSLKQGSKFKVREE